MLTTRRVALSKTGASSEPSHTVCSCCTYQECSKFSSARLDAHTKTRQRVRMHRKFRASHTVTHTTQGLPMKTLVATEIIRSCYPLSTEQQQQIRESLKQRRGQADVAAVTLDADQKLRKCRTVRSRFDTVPKPPSEPTNKPCTKHSRKGRKSQVSCYHVTVREELSVCLAGSIVSPL